VREADAAALEQLAFLEDAAGATAALGALPGVGTKGLPSRDSNAATRRDCSAVK